MTLLVTTLENGQGQLDALDVTPSVTYIYCSPRNVVYDHHLYCLAQHRDQQSGCADLHHLHRRNWNRTTDLWVWHLGSDPWGPMDH